MRNKTMRLVLVLILILGLLAGCSYNKDYGNQLPPDLPSSVPIVEGTIEDSRRTTFEVDKGFVVGIRTPLNYEETIQYYDEALKTNGYTAVFKEATIISDAPERMMTFEANKDALTVFGEIGSRENSTYVNLAVHLGK